MMSTLTTTHRPHLGELVAEQHPRPRRRPAARRRPAGRTVRGREPQRALLGGEPALRHQFADLSGGTPDADGRLVCRVTAPLVKAFGSTVRLRVRRGDDVVVDRA